MGTRRRGERHAVPLHNTKHSPIQVEPEPDSGGLQVEPEPVHVLYMQTFLLARYRVFGRNDVESQTFETSHAHVHALRNRLGCNGAPQFPI